MKHSAHRHAPRLTFSRIAWSGICFSVVAILGLAWPFFVTGALAAASASGDESLQITSPGPSGIADHNQLKGRYPATVAISDEAAEVRPGQRTITGIAKGMKNVAVIVPAGGSWSMAEPNGNGAFTANVTIPDEAGPLPIEVIAWNSPPNDAGYTVELKARIVLFVAGGRRTSAPTTLSAGHPASGMSLVWSDEFNDPLSISDSRTHDATWFAGGKPSVTGSQYSESDFVRSDDARKPFFQKGGFLRIRANHDPKKQDPASPRQAWWSGHLSTGFPDGTASVQFREGYAEVRMMCPAGPGTWPAFWLLDSASTPTKAGYGAVEIDVMEGYGHDRSAYMATMHRWPGSNPKQLHAHVEKRVAMTGSPDAFHTYGVRVTRAEVIWYLDGTEVQRAPLYRAEVVSDFFLMINLSMGGGWPITVPPAGHYDLWVDYVAVFR